MTDSILILGGGLAGLTAAIECAQTGARAIVVEHDAVVGGRLAAAMTRKSSVGDAIDGVPIPKLDALLEVPNIEFLTLADLQEIDGRPGNFAVSIRERARFVTDDCTLCNHCRPVCPVVLPNEHDAGLSYRKAIYAPLPETLPQEFVIDIDACLNKPPNYLPCNHCTEVCDDDAIHFDVPLEHLHKRQVGAVILSTGFGVATDGSAEQRGYGEHPDVVTMAEMERLLTAPGPTGGFAARPSDEEYPNSVLYVLNDLTPFAVHTAASQIGRLIAQDVSRIALLVTNQPGDAEQASLLQSLPKGLTVNHGLLQKVEVRADNRLTVIYADFASSRVPEEQYDMLVLGSDIRPASGLEELASVIGCDLADSGYVARPDSDSPCATSRPGVYVAGGAAGPAIHESAVEQARAAASAALTHLDARLLGADHAPTGQPDVSPGAVGVSEEEVRARIERALFAMLDGAG